MIRVSNIVAIAECRDTFDLPLLADNLEKAEYNPEGGTHWLRWRVGPHNKYVAFYRSGKFLLTGCGTMKEVRELAKIVADTAREFQPFKNYKLEVVNIVCNDFVTINHSLDALYLGLGYDRCFYEIEQFPAIRYKGDNSVSILLFASGSIVCTGARTINEAKSAIRDFKELVRKADS